MLSLGFVLLLPCIASAVPLAKVTTEPSSTTLVSTQNYIDDCRFVLFTRKNPTDYQVLNVLSKRGLDSSNFDYDKPTKIIAFGWENNVTSDFPRTLREAYLNVSDVNVIIIDWAPIAAWNYIEASRVVRLIGDFVAQVLGLLFEYGVKPETVHLIGHSLGAHVVGLAGKNSPILLPRVTGLDPAGPLFSNDSPYRISNESARFVDIIHTCGAYLGFFDRLGHVDFYPNGGVPFQPGCSWDVQGWCSHHRAFIFYTESVLSPNAFPATPCDSWDDFEEGKCNGTEQVLMGEAAPTTARGSYFLTTNEDTPYGMGTA